MATTGTAILDFGAYPGSTHATLAVASAAIASGSLPEAFIYPLASADHSADEHMVENVEVCARDVVAGVGFTLHGTMSGGNVGYIVGKWTVGWAWV